MIDHEVIASKSQSLITNLARFSNRISGRYDYAMEGNVMEGIG